MALDISDIPTLLVIAGIVFLFIAIVRNISGTVATTIDRKSATILGISGVILFALGLITASTGTFLPSDTIDTIPPTSTPDIMEDISPLPTYVIKNTSTSSGIIRLEQRGGKIYVEIVIYEEGKKKGPYFFSAPPPPPTITETPEPTPTSIPTETPIHTLTPEQQTE